MGGRHVCTGEVAYPGQHLYTCDQCSYRRVIDITTDPPTLTLIDPGDESVLHSGSVGPVALSVEVEIQR